MNGGLKALEERVFDRGLCVSCGACVSLCPYLRSWQGRTVKLDECNLGEGRCFDYCPRGKVDLEDLHQKFFGGSYEEIEIGTIRSVLMARASDSVWAGRVQNGGVVSALTDLAIKEGFIDAAVLTGREVDLLPQGHIVRGREDIMACAGSIYTSGPTLEALNRGPWTGDERIGIVGLPCMVLALAKMTTSSLDGRWFEKKHLGTLLTTVESAKAVSRGNTSVVIGGGTGRSKQTQSALLEAMSKISVPMVIDADAIHALAEDPSVIKGKKCIVTPNSSEFFILTGKKIYGLSHKEKIKIVKEESKRLGVVILLKDKPDIISDGNGVALNESGSPYMSVGGTGDVLAGICGALLARVQSSNPFLVAQAAIYISGEAGALAAKELKESLTPMDVIRSIPKVLH